MNKLLPKLKSCPFCGVLPNMLGISKHQYYVECGKCKLQLPVDEYYFTSEENAIKAWNKRTVIDKAITYCKQFHKVSHDKSCNCYYCRVIKILQGKE